MKIKKNELYLDSDEAKVEDHVLSFDSSVSTIIEPNKDGKNTHTLVIKKPLIIVLSGRGNTGKTTTLRKVVDKLMDFGAVPICGPYYKNKDDVFIGLKFGKTTIAIATEGDMSTEINKGIELLHSCTIIYYVYILASRSKGETRNCISSKFHGQTIIRLDRQAVTVDNDSVLESKLRNQVNEQQSDFIISLI